MDTQFPLTELQELAATLPPQGVVAALAGRGSELEALVEAQRRDVGWGAAAALRGGLLWLMAGRSDCGDDLVLEADALEPGAGIVPNWWGLWPAEPSANPAIGALARLYIQLRHQPPLELWQLVSPLVQQEPQWLDLPALQLLLGLLIAQREQLPGSLEEALEQVMGEAFVAAHPALAWRLFDALSERLPAWDYALLKAADLSLQRGELERCGNHLQRALPPQRELYWLHDIQARFKLAGGDVAAALAAWQRAQELAQAKADQAEVELFRQRAREARRGPGVLQARALLNRGEREAAVVLLNDLLAQDPQWQPLRSLLEQARGEQDVPAASSDGLARLEAALQQLAQRSGVRWPPPGAAVQQTLPSADGWQAFLQQALGRLALLG
jgi:hypothetical protein